MKKTIKNARKYSMYGLKAKHKLKIVGLASLLLIVIGIVFFSAGDAVGSTIGMALAFAPIAAFVLPENVEFTENEKKALEALGNHFNSQFDKLQKGFISQEFMNKSITDAFEKFVKDNDFDKNKMKGFEDALKQQGIELKQLKENTSEKSESLKEVLKNFMGTEDFKTSMKEKKVQELELKEEATAATITTANVTGTHTLSYEVVPGIQGNPYEGAILFARLSKGITNSRTIIWINRKDKEGAAAFIAEGELKPLKDWTYEEENSTAKKVAVSTKVSTEMLEDFDFMEGEIRLLLERAIYDEVNDKLLNGDGEGANPTGIISVASSYVGTALDGTIITPNDVDAIRAAILQLRNLNYHADVVFVNPATLAAIDLTKSDTGFYLKIEMDGILKQIRMEETSEIPVGYFLMMDSAKWVVKTYKGFRLEFGWENEDFRKNLVTVIAEMRLHSYSNSIDAGAFLYSTFEDVKGALEETTVTEE